MNCKHTCRHSESCNILGECVFEHSFFADNAEAHKLLAACPSNQILHLFKRFADRRYSLPSKKNRWEYKHEGALNVETAWQKGMRIKAERKEKNRLRSLPKAKVLNMNLPSLNNIYIDNTPGENFHIAE
jgi:hypothetical protein